MDNAHAGWANPRRKARIWRRAAMGHSIGHAARVRAAALGRVSPQCRPNELPVVDMARRIPLHLNAAACQLLLAEAERDPSHYAHAIEHCTAVLAAHPHSEKVPPAIPV